MLVLGFIWAYWEYLKGLNFGFFSIYTPLMVIIAFLGLIVSINMTYVYDKTPFNYKNYIAKIISSKNLEREKIVKDFKKSLDVNPKGENTCIVGWRTLIFCIVMIMLVYIMPYSKDKYSFLAYIIVCTLADIYNTIVTIKACKEYNKQIPDDEIIIKHAF